MSSDFNFNRLPKNLQDQFRDLYVIDKSKEAELLLNNIYQGDCRDLLPLISPNSIAVSIWSPPYYVGKNYEKDWTYEQWQNLLWETIRLHFSVIQPGGFLVINIADILCFKDAEMPRIQADSVTRKRVALSRHDILQALAANPTMKRQDLAAHFKCSEQTIDRRLNGNNIRGGKQEVQTRVKIVGGLLEKWALKAGLYPYDRRVWVKDAAWENSRWTSLSYKAVDEFEYIYIFWKPGITKHDRARLTGDEWKSWGSRAIWTFPSVRANNDHEAKFPIELPTRVIRLLSDPGDTILDCFMGSGTTAVAAIREKRNYIGIELDVNYVKLAKSKIQKEIGLFSQHYNHVN